jgi:O-methyltransferase
MGLFSKASRSKRKYYKDIFQKIPDGEFYRPLFSPWHAEGFGEFKNYYNSAKSVSLVSADRCYMLYAFASQAINLSGNWYECGVFRGGTAAMLAMLLNDKLHNSTTQLHLFDTFEGMPDTDPEKDLHQQGDFSDTSLEAVSEQVLKNIQDQSLVHFHKGFIPDTFASLESHQISFAHIDVDIYKSIIDCCEFIYPRMQGGGFMIFDDYGFGSCPGAREAVDEFFKDKAEQVVVLPTGQALVCKLCDIGHQG